LRRPTSGHETPTSPPRREKTMTDPSTGSTPGTGPAPLAGKTILMSGGSRGIGLAIALRAARDGANVALMAKTDAPHPKLEGTVHSAAELIRAAGGHAISLVEHGVQHARQRAH